LFSKYSRLHKDSNSQIGSPFGNVWAHSLALSHIPKSVNVIPKLHSWPTSFHAFVSVASWKLGLWQWWWWLKYKFHFCKGLCRHIDRRSIVLMKETCEIIHVSLGNQLPKQSMQWHFTLHHRPSYVHFHLLISRHGCLWVDGMCTHIMKNPHHS